MKKWLIIAPLFAIGLGTLALHLMDATYLWTAANIVYFRGETGVCIYDYPAHDTRPIKHGTVQEWPLDERYNKNELSKEIMSILDELETTAFLVIKDGKLLNEHYFREGSKTERSGLWSVTKTYTSFALLKAIDDGLISSIDDPVSKYIPEWNVEQNPPVTLRHLASMSAGLSWDEMDKSPLSLIAKYNFYGDLDDLSVRSLTAIGSPGEIQHYNSGGTQLLGTVLGRVLGEQNLSDYLSENFWQPLGCEQDGLYILDSKKKGNEKAFGGMVASARDIARLGQVLLDDGTWRGQTILKPKWMELIKTVPYQNKTYTYGLWTGVYEGERFYFQAGYKGQLIITVPAYNLVITRLGHEAYPKADLEDVPKEVFDYIREGVRLSNF